MGGKLRNLWPVLWVVVVAGAAAWVLYAVWRSPQRNDLATYGAFAVALIALVAGWMPGRGAGGRNSKPERPACENSMT
jgi:hypothetical protein